MSKSLSRGLEILQQLDADGRTLDELAASLDVHKTTVLRLLHSLEERRFVRRDARRYYLGSGLFALATDALRQHDVREHARPHLQALSRAVGGHTVHLAGREGEHIVYIDKVESTHSIRMYSRVGLTAPLHCTAVGRVLTAARPRREWPSILAAIELRPYTQHTITDVETLLGVLEEVARRGWALDRGEHEEFVTCIAAPIHDGEGAVVAAVSITVPAVLLPADDVETLVPDLLATAAAIDADLREPVTPAVNRRQTPDDGTS
jgi:DNA-binding IclR family transcriptional regulator